MTTVISNPGNGDSGAGIIIGVIIALVLIILFFVYGLPAIRGNSAGESKTTNINVEIPNPSPAADGGASGGTNGSTEGNASGSVQ